MFEKVKIRFYESFTKSISDRINFLDLTRAEILNDPKRVSHIINGDRDAHYPHLIGSGEYAYLNNLFLCKDHKSFNNKNKLHLSDDERKEMKLAEKERKKRNGNDYDEMLWGHIDWDEMLEGVISELSKLAILNKFGKRFEDTLVDYIPYALIRYDELYPKYALTYIFPDDRKAARKKAIERVHLSHGRKIFRDTFYKHFSGKLLPDFDVHFSDFVLDYLKESKPKDHSIGLQAYTFYKNLSKYVADWQNLPEVQYVEENAEKSDLETLLQKYREYGWKHIQELIKYQQEFDNFHIDTK